MIWDTTFMLLLLILGKALFLEDEAWQRTERHSSLLDSVNHIFWRWEEYSSRQIAWLGFWNLFIN